jgi:hypothetical protein
MTWPLLLGTLLVTAPPDTPGLAHALSVSGGLSGTDAQGTIGYRLRSPGGWQLGAELSLASSRDTFISGYAAEGGLAYAGSAIGLAPLLEVGPLELSLAAHLGLRALVADQSVGPDTRATTLLSRFGPVASVRLAESVALRAGWLNVVNVQLSPTADLEALGQVVMLGLVTRVADQVSLFADFETGGVLGFDGDGTKLLARGTVGVRWILDGDAARWTNF